MQTIVLIACSNTKLDRKAKAKEIYTSQLFIKSYKYACSLHPDKIFILSALHHLLDIEKEIEPYNVTLSYVPKAKRLNGLIVLDKKEKEGWGEKVIKQLKMECDIETDEIIILAGNEYLMPLKQKLKNIKLPLEGLPIGKKLSLLTKGIQ